MKGEPTEEDWFRTLERAMRIIRQSKTTEGGMVIVHHDGSMTEERWTATDLPEGGE